MRIRSTPRVGPGSLVVPCACAIVALADAPIARARPEETADLSLGDFLRQVEADSASLTAARERAAAARHRVEPAGTWADPFVALGPDDIALGQVREEPGGEPVWPRPVLRYQITQALPFPGRLGAREAAAAAEADVADAGVDVSRRALRVQAVQLFLRALYVQEAHATNVRLRATLDDVEASARARYAAGAAAVHHEILLAAAERAVLARDALELERDLTVLHARMNELRRIPPGTPRPRLIDDGAFETTAPPPPREQVLAEQPELRALDAALRAADAQVEVAQLAGFPDVVLQLMAVQSFMPELPSRVGAMVGVSLPVFWGSKQAEIARAAAREGSALRAEQDALRLRLETEWVEALSAWRTARDTVRLYESEVIPATRQALTSAQAAYVAREAPLIEVLAVVRAKYAVELEHVAARLDVRLARVRLEELLSSPPVLRLAPSAPTLFGAGMNAGGGMPARPPQMRSAPIRIGPGVRAPSGPEPGDMGGGMEGMR